MASTATSASVDSGSLAREERRAPRLLPEEMRGALIPAQGPGRARLSYIDPVFVGRAQDCLRAKTPDCVMETFGVSVNTWVKLRRGEPIRTSVAERFLQRLGG